MPFGPAVKPHSVENLIKAARDGRFAIPKLQRGFVWSSPKAVKLLDSIHRGLPIGALTLWETTSRNHLYLRAQTQVLPPFSHANGSVWFLLDGQQRLSVLFRLMEGGQFLNAAHKEVDFDRICFRVTDGEEESRFQYRHPEPRKWVRVRDILAKDWQRKLDGLTTGQLNRAGRFRENLLSYRIPVLSLASDSLDDARELFIRINSAGTPIRSADRAFARATRFDLRELAKQAWEALPKEFKGITDEVILQTRALLDGIQEVGSDAMTRAVEHWESSIAGDESIRKDLTKCWERQRKATERAIDLLKKEFHVIDDGLLPSKYMIATLAVFFDLRPKQPSKGQLEEIRKWFWATSLGSRYSGRGHRQNILADASFFRSLAEADGARFRLEDPLDPSILRSASYVGRSSVSDAFFCLLIAQGPVYLSNGSRMQIEAIAAAANRKHKHHIFPRKFLQGRGVGRGRMNSALNLCLISAEENSEYGSRPPARYLEQFTGLRHFESAMKRHLIPCSEDSGLWGTDARSYAQFLKARQELVIQAFEKAAGCRLFRTD